MRQREGEETAPDSVADNLVAQIQAWGTPNDDLTLVVCQRIPLQARALASAADRR